MSKSKKRYILKCWIPVDMEDQEQLTEKQAIVELVQAELMQPENIYKIVAVDELGNEVD
jgi:hypothetical protein